MMWQDATGNDVTTDCSRGNTMWWQGSKWLLVCSCEDQDENNVFQGKESKNASLKHLLDKNANVKVAVRFEAATYTHIPS